MKTRTWITCLWGLVHLFPSLAQTHFVSQTPQNRKALLEEYTGINCGHCPEGHKTASDLLAAYPEDVFLMNVHGTSFAVPHANDIDLRTASGDSLITQAGVTSVPSGSINRHLFDDAEKTVLFHTSWNKKIPEILEMPACANIAAKATIDWQSRQISVRVQLYYTGNTDLKHNFIHVALVQDSIIGYQNGTYLNPAQVLPNGKYVHLHVFRQFFTGTWGQQVEVQTGTVIEKTFTQTLPEQIGNVPLNLRNLHILAFVSENKEEIINVCKAEVENVNRPAYFAAFENPAQIEHASCDKNVRFAIDFQNLYLSEKAVNKIHYSCTRGKVSQEYTYEPEKPVQPGETIRFKTPEFTLRKTNTFEKVNFKILSVNDEAFSDQTIYSTEIEAIKYYGVTENADINLQVNQDRFGTDITWVLKDSINNTVLSAGPYENLNTRGTLQHDYSIKISEGCHTFTIYDKSHDGINNGMGEGSIRFLDKDENVFINHNGKYKDSAVITLKIGKIEPDEPDEPDEDTTVSVRPQQPQLMRVYPNPCRNVLNIELNQNDERALDTKIFRIDGRQILHLKGSTSQIDLHRLPAGFYILEVRSGKNTYRSKILKL